MYYLIRKIKDNFEVAKFTDYSEPEDVYTIKKGKCNCPASYRSNNCKHKKLVEAYTTVPSYYEIVNDSIKVTEIEVLKFVI